VARRKFREVIRKIRDKLPQGIHEQLDSRMATDRLIRILKTPDYGADIKQLQMFTDSADDVKTLERFLLALKNLTQYLGLEP
jgi:hypothetical protein